MTISCIVPVRDGARYLGEALESVFGQTLVPDEVIVVDDGSSDGSAEVASRFNVRLVGERGRGPAAARNAGLREARGEFVTFLDSDDLWSRDKIARQVAWMGGNAGAAGCIGLCRNFVDDPGESPLTDLLERLWTGFNCSSLLARRETFELVGPFNEAMIVGEDTEWFARARASQAVIGVLDELLLHRRIHDGNLSRVRWAESRASVLDFVKLQLDRRRSEKERP